MQFHLVLILLTMYLPIPSIFSILLLHVHYPPSPECCDLSLIDSHVVLEGNEVDCSKSPGTFREYGPSLDPYSLYLEDVPGKIMLIIAFDHSTDFSTTFDKLRRALTIIPSCMFGCSYLHLSELHAQVFDKRM